MKIIGITTVLFFALVTIGFAWNPFEHLFKPPAPPVADDTDSTSDIFDFPESTTKSPFLKEFLIVYQGDWVFIPNDLGTKYNIHIFKAPGTYNVDKTECCGKLLVSFLDSNSIISEYSFCLSSTYEIHIRNKEETIDLKCIGVRGARITSPLHPTLPGYAIDDPTLINCGTFWLVRPE